MLPFNGFYENRFLSLSFTESKPVSIKSLNRPFPSSKKSHFESEAKCEAIDMEMIFNYDANKTHFHNKGFALSLVLKVRFFGTRKWPIGHKSAPGKNKKGETRIGKINHSLFKDQHA